METGEKPQSKIKLNFRITIFWQLNSACQGKHLLGEVLLYNACCKSVPDTINKKEKVRQPALTCVEERVVVQMVFSSSMLPNDNIQRRQLLFLGS